MVRNIGFSSSSGRPLSRRGFVAGLPAISAGVFSATRASSESAQTPQAAARSSVADPASAAPRGPIKLDANENPFAPSERAIRAATEANSRAGNRYPRNAVDLATAIAKRYRVGRESVLLSNGSGELLRAAVPAFVDAKRALVAGLPTFETCTGTARAQGLPVREVPIDAELRLDLAQMEDAAAGAGLLFFCNPNNPTGTTWPAKDVAAMIDRLAARSPETTILVDEAYAHFVEMPGYESFASRAAKDRRVFVTGTFSKAFGMAGMRVGWAIGHPDTLATLRAQMTGSLNVASVAAALVALEDEVETKRQVALNNQTRAVAAKVFTDLGYTVPHSDCNFIIVDVRRPPEKFQAACREKGVLVGRPFPGLKTHARISIGTADEMIRAAEVFKAVLAQPA